MNHKRISLLFSGQGAQTVGMGRELAGHFPSVAALFSKADAILGYSLSRIMWEGPDSELTQTRYCQPALFVHGIACLTALRQVAGTFPVHAVAGLSLGEFTAHVAAGLGITIMPECMSSFRGPIHDHPNSLSHHDQT